MADPVFKGCTRPPMLLGVPMVPLMVVVGGLVIGGAWMSMFNQFLMLFIWILVIPAVFVLQAMSKKDDQIFRLMFLKLLFRNKNEYGGVTLEPFDYREDLIEDANDFSVLQNEETHMS